MESPMGINVFLSYAREDSKIAEKLYKDLTKVGVNVWFDKASLLAGQKWEIEIQKAIRDSSFFIALLSSNSISKRGYVQKELKQALDVLDELPESKAFIIPVRVDDCDPDVESLRHIHRVDIFPSYKEGLKHILRVVQPLDATFLETNVIRSSFGNRAMMDMTVLSPKDEQKQIAVKAILDTGAVMTCIPKYAIEMLGSSELNYSLRRIRSAADTVEAKTYFVDIKFADLVLKDLEVILIDRDYALIGTDILTHLIVLYDGPSETVKVWIRSNKKI